MTDLGLIVIRAFILPFQSERDMARDIVGTNEFVEVFIDTPLSVADERDMKGLYAKARRRSEELQRYRYSYAPPKTYIDTTQMTVDESANYIIGRLDLR